MNNPQRTSKGKLLVAGALFVGAAMFLYVFYLGPELASHRAMLASQKAAAVQEWEEGKTITGEAMPSPELALAYLQTLMAATFETYEVVATNIVAAPKRGAYSIEMDSSSAVGAVMELADRRTSQVEKQLAREVLESSGRERNYVSSTNYTCELKVKHFSPRKGNGKPVVLMSVIPLSVDYLKASALRSKWEKIYDKWYWSTQNHGNSKVQQWQDAGILKPDVLGVKDSSDLQGWLTKSEPNESRWGLFGNTFPVLFKDEVKYVPGVYDYVIWKRQQQLQLCQNFVMKNLQGYASRLPTWSPENLEADSPQLSAETVSSLCAKLAASPNATGATLINTSTVACVEFSRGMPRVGSDNAGLPWANEGESDAAFALKFYVLISARK
jgi:hypothetical protein